VYFDEIHTVALSFSLSKQFLVGFIIPFLYMHMKYFDHIHSLLLPLKIHKVVLSFFILKWMC
jgi:hypothetical protein